jgi:hypothetical protein
VGGSNPSTVDGRVASGRFGPPIPVSFSSGDRKVWHVLQPLLNTFNVTPPFFMAQVSHITLVLSFFHLIQHVDAACSVSLDMLIESLI